LHSIKIRYIFVIRYKLKNEAMFDFHNHYTSIPNKEEKIKFRKKVIEILNINYNYFYMWLARNHIPPKFREDFANKVMQNPDLKWS